VKYTSGKIRKGEVLAVNAQTHRCQIKLDDSEIFVNADWYKVGAVDLNPIIKQRRQRRQPRWWKRLAAWIAR
jgi:hypothetical protein